MTEEVDTIFAAGGTVSGTEFCVTGECDDGLREFVDRIAWQEESGLVGNHDFTGSPDVVRDDRFSGNESLREDPSESFPLAGVDDHVHRGHECGDALGRDESGEDEVLSETLPRNLFFDVLSEQAVTDEEEADVRTGGDDLWGRLQDELVPFEVEQAGDFADDDVFFGKAELGAYGLALTVAFEKGGDVEATVNGLKSVG